MDEIHWRSTYAMIYSEIEPGSWLRDFEFPIPPVGGVVTLMDQCQVCLFT
ncbi:MAG: hypothetical protein ACLP7Q_02430 [Isosphaeraceae bacterium]